MDFLIIGGIVLGLVGYMIYERMKGQRPVPPEQEKDSIPGHSASFLLDNAETRVMNLLATKMASRRGEILGRCRANGDDTLYIALVNECDGPSHDRCGYPINPYGVPFKSGDWGKNLDMAWVTEARRAIEVWRGMGFKIIFVLMLDDSGSISSKPGAILKKYMSDMVEHFDDLGVGYWLGLEVDEYWNPATCRNLNGHLKSITKKPVGIHLTPMKHTNATWAAVVDEFDYYYLQYGFGLPISKIGEITRQVVSRFPGKVIASEYNLSSDSVLAKKQGQAAIKNGAIATGNGR